MKHFKLKYLSLLPLLVILSGCVSRDASGNPTGIIWDLIGKPMLVGIDWFASLLNYSLGSYGFGIIMVTIIARLILLPLHINMSKATTESQLRMAYIKPYMDELNNRIKQASSLDERNALQAEVFNLQRQAGIKLISAQGCLPLFIQLPILSALYFTTINTPSILNDVLFGIPLGQTSIILMILSSGLYYLQGIISQQGMTPEQKQANRQVLLMSPMINAIFALVTPAGAVLYWTVGGVFSCLISLYTTYILKPRMAKRIEEEFIQNPINYTMPTTRKTVEPIADTDNQQKTRPRRNEGKQRRK